MPLDGFPERPTVRQDFAPYLVAVLAVGGPTPLSPDPGLTSGYIDSFVVSVPSTALNSVFIGGPGVTVANGLELVPGSLTQWAIDQGGRQQYEMQKLLLALAAFAECKAELPSMIPFMTWDPATIFFAAAANTNITVCLFRSPFV